MEDLKKIVGKRLRESRRLTRLSQSDAAKRIGIHYTTLGKYELGEREPDFETMQKLAELYGTRIEDIVGSSGRPNRLEELRLNTNTPVQILAEMLNIAPGEYLILEKMGQQLDLAEVKRLAGYYGKTIDYVMGFGPHDQDEQKNHDLMATVQEIEEVANKNHTSMSDPAFKDILLKALDLALAARSKDDQ